MNPIVSFKPGVRVKECDSRLFVAIAIAAHVWNELGVASFWVTSMNDSTHRAGSYHYSGRAFDCRSHNLPDGLEDEARDTLQDRLGPKYRVILEDRGTPNEHIHVELRPEEL